MDKFINYYYGLQVKDIVNDDDRFFFKSGNHRYILKKYDDLSLDDYYENLKRELYNYKFFFTIIPNNIGKLITTINGNNYVLLRLSNISNDSISIFDIKADMFITNINYLKIICRNDWEYLWQSKIDYFELYIEEKMEYYSKLLWLYNYVVGMGELALFYLKETNKLSNKYIYDNLSIQHRRITYKTTMYDYYDPTNLVIDYSSRDLCEYLKTVDLDDLEYELLDQYFNKYNLSKYWVGLFYSRMLFPTIIFDNIEKMLSQKENVEIMSYKLEKSIIENMKKINYIGTYLNQKYGIPIINFKIK